jgi:2-polyprenyl-3-methyl-5-hydroxy-6-metoxy-1,4-benzoquinol methylase
MKSNASERFNTISNNFVTSEVHIASPTIELLHNLVIGKNQEKVCDIACGAGHLGLSFASKSNSITGVDPSQNMLDAFQALAEQRGIAVKCIQAYAESIPLPDNHFDVVVSRLAPHHFSDVEQAVREMFRLVKPGGVVAVIDLEGDEDPLVDNLNHQLEKLHDPTHVRSYTAARWNSFFLQAGLEVMNLESKLSERPIGVPVSRWCEIASSGSIAEAQIIDLLHNTSENLLDRLGVMKVDNEYCMPIRTLLILGRKPR